MNNHFDTETTSSIMVSVILSTYNDEKYIRESIESVLVQTYRNFEFIIWNDGSTDSTEDIVKSFRDDRIRYFYHENTGLGIALALACKEARGKYIARIDGDDICLPNRLEKEVNYLESHPDMVLVSSSVIYIDENGDTLGRSFPWTWSRNLRHNINIVHPAAMFRNDIYKKTCGYLNARSSQDRILWPKFLKHGELYNIKEPLIRYRLLSSSLSHSNDPSSPYSAMLEIIRRKMASDDIVLEQDIELQNRIYALSKTPKKDAIPFAYIKSPEEKLFAILRSIIGELYAGKVVFFMKNVYAFIRY